ncbi:MAG: YiiD C-terminal domain-containing protein [Moraxellaceae bacterium]|nr:YiiD C-terminal domain-containing protein [Moraxellaceae bacterium]
MSVDTSLQTAKALLERVRGQIPLTAAMQLRVTAFDGRELRLALPLAANINDKGTGFAGSISALGNITGWCLLTLWGEAELGTCQVAIADATFSFHKPVTTDFEAVVALPGEADIAGFLKRLAEKGRASLTLDLVIRDDEGTAASMKARYALWRV